MNSYENFLKKSIEQQEDEFKKLVLRNMELTQELDDNKRKIAGIQGNLQYERGLLKDTNEWVDIIKDL